MGALTFHDDMKPMSSQSLTKSLTISNFSASSLVLTSQLFFEKKASIMDLLLSSQFLLSASLPFFLYSCWSCSV